MLIGAPKDKPFDPSSKPPEAQYNQKLLRGPHHRIVDLQQDQLNPKKSNEAARRRYVVLQPGMHYWEGNQWKESMELIEKEGTGAIARQGQYKVRFAPNLNTAGAIDLTMPGGTRLRSHVLGLSYYDAATRLSALIAEVKDSVGEILPPNRIIYRDVFEGLKADVRYTWRKGDFEQDVILRENPPGPETFGLNPETSRLEVLTEFVDAPKPVKLEKVLRKETDAQKQRQRLEPDLVDETLGFGEMTMTHGRAFELEEEMPEYWRAALVAAGLEVVRELKPQVPVAKRWETLDGTRTFLIEAVELESVKVELRKLPAAKTQRRKQASLHRESPATRVASRGQADGEIFLAASEDLSPGFEPLGTGKMNPSGTSN